MDNDYGIISINKILIIVSMIYAVDKRINIMFFYKETMIHIL